MVVTDVKTALAIQAAELPQALDETSWLNARDSVSRLGLGGALASMDTVDFVDDKDLVTGQVAKKEEEEKAEASRLLSQMQGAKLLCHAVCTLQPSESS